jgi:site-specific DNA-methyltransferase (adenine-specific)
MKEMPDECIDMVLTSPPYDNLRDYSGYNFNFENTARELFRILKEGAVMVWVIGDASVSGSETGTSFRQALYFKEIGLNLFDTMIYQKRGGLMTGSTIGYSQKFEYMFVFSRGKIKTVNLIKDVPVKHTESRTKRHRRKDGTFDVQYWKIGGITRRNNIWIYDVGYQKTTKDKIAFKHPAIFPDALARDHIISWSNERDVVFDPLVGSGTTAKIAKNLKRNFIGIEINPDYCKIAEERLAQGVL